MDQIIQRADSTAAKKGWKTSAGHSISHIAGGHDEGQLADDSYC